MIFHCSFVSESRWTTGEYTNRNHDFCLARFPQQLISFDWYTSVLVVFLKTWPKVYFQTKKQITVIRQYDVPFFIKMLTLSTHDMLIWKPVRINMDYIKFIFIQFEFIQILYWWFTLIWWVVVCKYVFFFINKFRTSTVTYKLHIMCSKFDTRNKQKKRWLFQYPSGRVQLSISIDIKSFQLVWFYEHNMSLVLTTICIPTIFHCILLFLSYWFYSWQSSKSTLPLDQIMSNYYYTDSTYLCAK